MHQVDWLNVAPAGHRDHQEESMPDFSRFRPTGIRCVISHSSKRIGKWLLYLLICTAAILSFHPALIADDLGRPVLGHLTLVSWAVAVMLFAVFRPRARKKSAACRLADGLMAAAITYAAAGLVSVVLQDWTAEFDVVRRSIGWRLLLVLELTLVFTGTVLIIDRETRKKCGNPHKSCSED